MCGGLFDGVYWYVDVWVVVDDVGFVGGWIGEFLVELGL